MAKYVLRTPVIVAGENKTEVEIKEVWDAGDFIDVQNEDGKGNQAAQEVAIAIGWPVPFVRKLCIEDYMKILEIANGFFAKTLRANGKK